MKLTVRKKTAMLLYKVLIDAESRPTFSADEIEKMRRLRDRLEDRYPWLQEDIVRAAGRVTR